jgi:4-alpha-glucanotransferase
MLDELFERLARSRGLGEAYHDYRGELRHFSRASRAAVLEAMGCDVGDVAVLEREVLAADLVHWRQGVPAVTVLPPGCTSVPIVVPADATNRQLHWTLSLVDGGTLRGEVTPEHLHEDERREIDGRWLTRRRLPLPELPHGDHRLSLSMTALSFADGAIVATPGRCHEPPSLVAGRRLWGIAVQLYTLRSRRNWGVGDFGDLETVVRRAAPAGASFVGLNPLHALFAANPAHCSPYSPSSRQFLNVLYISVPAVPEFADCAALKRLVAESRHQVELARLRAAERVDYVGVAALKLPALRELYREFVARGRVADSSRVQSFARFRTERGEALRRHALHEAIDAHMRATDPAAWGWPAWPAGLRSPSSAETRDFERRHADEVGFHAWLQWVADEQLASAQQVARELGLELGLYGDYAVGVNPAGSETWSDQRVYRMQAAIGAPPDALALKGQDWGIPPQDPVALATDSYRPLRELLVANMRHFGALRIDHVMALFRQWWVPRGCGATDGVYVHYPLDDLVSVLALESERYRCLVVGEDLGTVPDEVRHAMARHGVYHYKVLLFEKHHDGSFRLPGDYERRAIATVTTHDLPTLRAYWQGDDIGLRDSLELFPGEEIRQHVIDERARDRRALLTALRASGLDAGGAADAGWTEAFAELVQRYLARSAAALVVLQLEDLIGMTDPVNVPGTSDQYPNWQRKITADIEDIFERDSVARVLSAVAGDRTS